MTTAVAERTPLPKEQLDLIRRTVANGATNDELALFLYDCERRGIHPLDKLLHFTKRGGRYTPVTSIDFMRSQAAASGEMAGSDDTRFEAARAPSEDFMHDGKPLPYPVSATVTVYRMTQGQRFAYTATARWSEYCPDNAPMWKRMPHTMLGKCAEALALRKAFPQQLAGLYAKEEMDQAEEPKAGYSVTPPVASTAPAAARVGIPPTQSGGDSERRPSGAEMPGDAALSPGSNDDGPDLLLPDGYVYIKHIDVTDTRNKNVKKALVTVSTGESYGTINPQLAALCEQLCQTRTPVVIESKTSKYGEDLVAVHTQKDVADIDAEIARVEMARQAGEIS